MTLESEFGIIYSRKRIPRVIRKFNVVCSIRKVNLYTNGESHQRTYGSSKYS